MIEVNRIYQGDCIEVMKTWPPDFVDTIITDPPYGIGFMGKAWDSFEPAHVEKNTTEYDNAPQKWHDGRFKRKIKSKALVAGEYDRSVEANREFQSWCCAWATEALRIAKPGAMMLVSGGTRTFHRMTSGLEDAGWQIRDCIMWLYGCLSDDTEILVDGGWVQYHKAIEGRHALCYNSSTDEYSWQPIQERFEYRISDTAYRIESDHTDQIVSKNHRCLVEQNGTYVFQYAEDAARQLEIRVPVLEDVRSLLAALPVPNQRTSEQEPGLFCGLPRGSDFPTAHGEAYGVEQESIEKDSVCRLCQTSLETVGLAEANPFADLFNPLQRNATRQGMAQTRLQGPCGVDGRIGEQTTRANDGPEELGMEGRRDVLSQAWELQTDQVCPMPAGVYGDGSERWLRHGASPNRGSDNWPEFITDRDGSPRRPEPTEQPTEELSPVQDKPRPQTVRASRFTKTDLARITPTHYQGIVWCVRVPTGAFVARRNGKVFVTGNSGFPKSLDLSKSIDKAKGAEREVIGKSARHGGGINQVYGEGMGNGEVPLLTAAATSLARQWSGWGTALKPAWEPIIVAMKPLDGTFAENAERHGVAGINVDGGRVDANEPVQSSAGKGAPFGPGAYPLGEGRLYQNKGRWPANLILDEEAAAMLDGQTGDLSVCGGPQTSTNQVDGLFGKRKPGIPYTDSGGASRFFYVAKSSRAERNEGCEDQPDRLRGGLNATVHGDTRTGHVTIQKNNHPTVKPLSLMKYLCLLTKTPTGGIVLDPFAGSGTTLWAAEYHNRPWIGIEMNPEYVAIAQARIARERSQMKMAI